MKNLLRFLIAVAVVTTAMSFTTGCGRKTTAKREGCTYGRNGSWECSTSTTSELVQTDSKESDRPSTFEKCTESWILDQCSGLMPVADRITYRDCINEVEYKCSIKPIIRPSTVQY